MKPSAYLAKNYGPFIITLQAMVDTIYAKHLPPGVSPFQIRFLRSVKAAGARGVTAIGRSCWISQPSATAALQREMARKTVEVHKERADCRRLVVNLSDLGVSYLKMADDADLAIGKELLARTGGQAGGFAKLMEVFLEESNVSSS